MGAYAAFTRSPGLILVVPILFELVRSRAKAREYIALFMVPLGFAAYCMINYSVSGDAFKFMEYQSIHWHQQLGWFFRHRRIPDGKCDFCRIKFYGASLGIVAAEPFGAAFVACGDDTCRKKDARIVYGVFYRVFCGDDGRDMASERAALSCGDDLTSGGNVGAYGKMRAPSAYLSC